MGGGAGGKNVDNAFGFGREMRFARSEGRERKVRGTGVGRFQQTEADEAGQAQAAKADPEAVEELAPGENQVRGTQFVVLACMLDHRVTSGCCVYTRQASAGQRRFMVPRLT